MADPLSDTALSEREKDVLALAGDGLTDKEIALQLSIATKTVRTYWDRMRQKMTASSRTQVIAKAFRQTYDALRASEETYRKLLDTCQEGVWLLDAEGATSFTSEKMSRILGYTPEELLTKRAREIVAPEDRERLIGFLTSSDAGLGNEVFAFKSVRGDGSLASLVMEASPRVDRHGQRVGTLLVITDMTDRDSRFWAIAEAASDPIAQFSRDERCLYANPALTDAMGVAHGWPEGKDLADMAFCSPLEDWRKGLSEALASGLVVRREMGGSVTLFIPQLDSAPSVLTLTRAL